MIELEVVAGVEFGAILWVRPGAEMRMAQPSKAGKTQERYGYPETRFLLSLTSV